MCRRRSCAKNAAHFETIENRQIEVEDDQVRSALRDGFQRRIAGGHDVNGSFESSFECVLEQIGEIRLVLDNKNVRTLHSISLVSRRCGGVTRVLIPCCTYRFQFFCQYSPHLSGPAYI